VGKKGEEWKGFSPFHHVPLGVSRNPGEGGGGGKSYSGNWVSWVGFGGEGRVVFRFV